MAVQRSQLPSPFAHGSGHVLVNAPPVHVSCVLPCGMHLLSVVHLAVGAKNKAVNNLPDTVLSPTHPQQLLPALPLPGPPYAPLAGVGDAIGQTLGADGLMPEHFP